MTLVLVERQCRDQWGDLIGLGLPEDLAEHSVCSEWNTWCWSLSGLDAARVCMFW